MAKYQRTPETSLQAIIAIGNSISMLKIKLTSRIV